MTEKAKRNAANILPASCSAGGSQREPSVLPRAGEVLTLSYSEDPDPYFYVFLGGNGALRLHASGFEPGTVLHADEPIVLDKIRRDHDTAWSRAW